MVCWEIPQKDVNIFIEKYAFDFRREDLSNLNNIKLFKDQNLFFILCIDHFLEYFLFQTESIFKNNFSVEEFTKYQMGKGADFEIVSFNYLSLFFNDIVRSVYYYPSNDRNCEIDILIRENNYLIIIECKSGTVELKSSSSDDEIKIKIHNKVKKAYKTLENACSYVKSNTEYVFKNSTDIMSGNSSDVEVICLHLSMYPLDCVSSNLHVLNNDYIGNCKNPKITMSFEHFFAICMDCNHKNRSIGDYLKMRKDNILKHPHSSFDINELDLYKQLTNEKSILSEFLNRDILDSFNEDVKIFTTVHNSVGKEIRPATEMLRNINYILFESFLIKAKKSYKLNKRYIRYLSEYLSITEEQ